jgi:hypothetical protein
MCVTFPGRSETQTSDSRVTDSTPRRRARGWTAVSTQPKQNIMVPRATEGVNNALQKGAW